MAEQLSVMMPVYNGARYVAAAIESVLRQTFSGFEFLIMDDGSTDGTAAILKHYAGQDSRIRLFPRPRQGQIASRNELLRLARNKIVACADADDICLPERFERQFAVINQDRVLWVLGTAMLPIDGQGRGCRPRRVITGSAAVAVDLERGCCIGHPSCMMRRDYILGIGGYRPAYQAAEDYDLFLRASEYGKVDNLPVAAVLYREHEASVSQTYSLRQAISADLARATHRLRIAGRPDPTQVLTAPPGLDDPLLPALIPCAQMQLHRALAITAEPSASRDQLDWALRHFLRAPIGKKQTRASQRAIVGLIGRRGLDFTNLAAAVRAASLGPGRLVRLLWRDHGLMRTYDHDRPSAVSSPSRSAQGG